MQMLKDITMFDGLYEKNLEYFQELQIYIAAGEEKLKELQETTLPQLHAEAAAKGDAMSAQVVRDFEDTVNRFEKKIHDLKLSKTVAIQTAPQIASSRTTTKCWWIRSRRRSSAPFRCGRARLSLPWGFTGRRAC